MYSSPGKEHPAADSEVRDDDSGLPPSLAALGRQLAHQAHQLGSRHPGRVPSTLAKDAPTRPVVASPARLNGPGAVAIALGIALAIVVLPQVRQWLVNPTGSNGPLAAHDPLTTPRMRADSQIATPVATATASAAPEPYTFEGPLPESAGTDTAPLFLRNVSGPELEALIDLRELHPGDSASVSI